VHYCAVEQLLANDVPAARRHAYTRRASSETFSAVLLSRDLLETILSFLSLRKLHAVATTSQAWHRSLPIALKRWECVEHWQVMMKTETGKAVIEDCVRLCSPLSFVPDRTRAGLLSKLSAALNAPLNEQWPSLVPRVIECIHAWAYVPRDTAAHPLALEAAVPAAACLFRVWKPTREQLKAALKPSLLLVADGKKCLANRQIFAMFGRVLRSIPVVVFNETLSQKLLDHLHSMPSHAAYLAAPDDEKIAIATTLIQACYLACRHRQLRPERPDAFIRSAKAELPEERLVARLIEGVRRLPRPPCLRLTDPLNEQLLRCLEHQQLANSPAALATVSELRGV